MKARTKLFAIGIITMLLLVRAAAAQETKQDGKQEAKDESASEASSSETERGPIEFGFRTFWGDVYGRPDLPFKPDLATSKLNEYSDIRTNFFIRRGRINIDDVLGTRNYLNYQTQSSFYNNQSHLGSFGQYGKFKLQFRYDEIPHIYTNTARTLFIATQPGVYTLPLIIRQGLQGASSTGTAAQISNNLPSFVATQVVPGEQFIVPQIQRRAGTGLFSYNNVAAPLFTFILWWTLAALLAGVALVVGRRRQALVLVGLVAATIFLPVAIQLVEAYKYVRQEQPVLLAKRLKFGLRLSTSLDHFLFSRKEGSENTHRSSR